MEQVRITKPISQKKATGAHYTPPQFAAFLSRRILSAASVQNVSSLTVLDPACGDGELLCALANSLPEELRDKADFVGVDSDALSLSKAHQRLSALPLAGFTLKQTDFLELVGGCRAQLDLFRESSPNVSPPLVADIIIANPPYVRTQILGAAKAQELACSFGLSGRTDLYHAFLVAMTRCLKPGGVLGVITSNRFLFTESGAAMRKFLTREYEVIEVLDLGDTKLFDAAVLPAVFVGRRRLSDNDVRPTSRSTPKFVRIYERLENGVPLACNGVRAESVFEVIQRETDGDYAIGGRSFSLTSGILDIRQCSEELWTMLTTTERAWFNAIDSNAACRIAGAAKVRVGIKTTADEVFIRTDWDRVPYEARPEKELLRELLSHSDANRWLPSIAEGRQRRVLYTHQMKNGQRKAIDLGAYPKAAAYFEKNRGRLESRTYVTEGNRRWYEIWVPQDPGSWSLPKVVFPDISPDPRFFYDGSGRLVDGNCYWITLLPDKSTDMLFLIMGVCNSKLMTRYHDLVFSNKLYSGRRRYLTQYVSKYPLPDPESASSREIIQIVKDLIGERVDTYLRAELERSLEIAVGHAFGVEPVLATQGLWTDSPS